jgi:hypothetical protein
VVRAAEQANGETASAGRGAIDFDQLSENLEELIYLVARGDITKYEAIGQKPGDLFFKLAGWIRREEKQRMEFEAALHGVRLNKSNTSNDAAKPGKSFSEMAGKFSRKINIRRIKKKRKT